MQLIPCKNITENNTRIQYCDNLCCAWKFGRRLLELRLSSNIRIDNAAVCTPAVFKTPNFLNLFIVVLILSVCAHSAFESFDDVWALFLAGQKAPLAITTHT